MLTMVGQINNFYLWLVLYLEMDSKLPHVFAAEGLP